MASTREALAKGNFYWFDSEQIEHPDEDHELYDIRSTFPPNPFLVDSFRAKGFVGDPIQCVSEDGRLLIADGRRRHRAIEAINKSRTGDERIRCKVEIVKLDGFDTMAIGNSMRLEETPLQIAEKARRRIANGYKIKEVAKIFGCTEQTIRNYLDLATAPADVKQAVASGEVSATLAKDLAKHDPETRKEIIAAGPVKGEAGKARIADPSKPKSRKVPAAMVKALYKDIPPAATGFEGYTRALLGVILGNDPEGESLKKYAGGSEIYLKIKQAP